MKYLHDDRLAELTQDLTDRAVGGAVSQRVINGRIEAYTMKRGTREKKYAFKLGEKFVASLEHLAQDVSMIQKASRKRSFSTGLMEEIEPISKQESRSRSCSFDISPSPSSRKLLPEIDLSKKATMPSALGDFAAQGTRRLMVRTKKLTC
jgi:hypothetical protein